MSGSRVWLRTAQGVRLLVGLVVAVGLVAAVVVSAAATWPGHVSTPVTVAARPVPADTLLACDGPILAAGRSADDAAALGVAAPTQVVADAAGASDAEEFAIGSPDVTDSPGVPVLLAPVVDRETQDVAAASSGAIADPDLRGFAADACRPALFDSWLVGGSGTTGAADLVVLSNPGDVAATVDVTVYGAAGTSLPPGGQAVTVAARTQRVLPLAGLALGEEGPVVRVAARGAPVRASLQTSIVRTLVPLGVDQSSAIASPSLRQVIPGVAVTAPPGEAGASDAATILRVLAPASDTTATVRVISDGPGGEESSTVQLRAGVPADVELGGLDRGVYTVVVESDVETVAAVWQSAGADFAWLTSSPEVTGVTSFAVAAGESSSVRLANPGAQDVTVTLSRLVDGADERSIDIAAGTTERVNLPAGTTWRLDSGDAWVHASVVFAATDAIAGYAVWPQDPASGAITVHP